MPEQRELTFDTGADPGSGLGSGAADTARSDDSGRNGDGAAPARAAPVQTGSGRLSLKRLELTNFCQHMERVIEFKPGLNVIVGQIGTGKSNLLKAIRFALTGSSGNDGRKAEDITRGEKAGKVALEFSAGGLDCVITRHLEDARCRLTAGEESLRSARDVDERMGRLMGADWLTAFRWVFTDQGEIDSVVFETSAKRAETFGRMFGTWRCEKIRDAAQALLLELSVESRRPAIDRMKDELARDVEPVLAQARADLETADKARLTPDAEKDLRVRLDEASRQAERGKEAAKASEQADRLADRLVEPQAQVGELRTRIRDLSLPLESRAARLARLEEALADAVAGNDLALRRGSAEQDRRKAQKRIQDALASADRFMDPPPPAPASAKALDDMGRDLTSIRARQSAARRMLAAPAAQDSSGGACVTCGQDLSPESLERIRKALDADNLKESTLTPLFLLRNQQLDEWNKVVRNRLNALDLCEREVAAGEAEIARAEKDLAALPAAPAGRELSKADSDELRDAAEVRKEIARLRDRLDVLEPSLRRDEAELEGLRRTAASAPTDARAARAVVEDLEATLALHRAARELAAAADASVKGLQARRGRLLAAIGLAEAEEADVQRKLAWRGLLERLRVILHKQALPALSVKRRLPRFNRFLASRLSWFFGDNSRNRFLAEVDQNLDLVCRDLGGAEFAARRLSGGQKTLLGLALRMAVYDLFAAKVGPFILDEPSVFLDEESVAGVSAALGEARDFLRAAGLQVLVVTHEERLAAGADHVIRLE